MAYVVAAYIIVLGAMGFYWWTLIFRANRLGEEISSEGRLEGFDDSRDSEPGERP